MKNASVFILAVIILITAIPVQVWSAPTTADQAEMVVQGWLLKDDNPLDTQLGRQIAQVQTFYGDSGQPLYYIVSLQPQGFVVVSADDQIEPIIAFVRQGFYDPSPLNPLAVLVTQDLTARIQTLRQSPDYPSPDEEPLESKLLSTDLDGTTASPQDMWTELSGVAETADNGGGLVTLGVSDISDVRVPALVKSQWGQSDVLSSPCYNYYTPGNYPCGFLATALAQLLRYHEHPSSGIGQQSFTILVDWQMQTVQTLGGDGLGGPYLWNQMELIPSNGVTEQQRQAIGALCFDAGISVNMSYTSSLSQASLLRAADSLQNTFMYSNAVKGQNGGSNIGSGLTAMLNPNLDAGFPVILGIFVSGAEIGQAVICDGYGYHFWTMYHHLNMGASGSGDIWYSLPTVGSFNTVSECIYNIFVAETGEIISGRVLDNQSVPLDGALVTAQYLPDPCDSKNVISYQGLTNAQGIYALVGVPSQTDYTVSVIKEDYLFDSQETSTGTSIDYNSVSGNVWGLNFTAQPPPPPPPANDNCQQAIDLIDGISFYGYTYQATPTLTGDPCSPYFTSGCVGNDPFDVWHTYTPTIDCCNVSISLCGSSFDTTLSVYSSCDLQHELACNDDSFFCSTRSAITMPMTTGETYLIRVAGWNQRTGDYIITVTGGEGGIFRLIPPFEYAWPTKISVTDCLTALGGTQPYRWTVVPSDEYSYATESSSFGTAGTGQGWQGDDQMWTYNLTFGFTFYGTEYHSVNVSSNGFLDFVNNLSLKNNSTEKLLQNVIIAPLWDDLDTTGGDIYIYNAEPNEVTFWWQGVTWQDGTPCNFAVTLYKDSRIRFDYGSGNQNLTPTIGISAGNGSDYLLIEGYDQNDSLTNADSIMISFSPLPPGVSLNASTGCFDGIPQQLGSYSATIKVTDSSDPPQTIQADYVFNIETFENPDINRDECVNLEDFAILASYWLWQRCDDYNLCDLSDIDQDGQVTSSDLSFLVESWLLGTCYCSGQRLINAPYAGGTGTESDPYTICSAAQLNEIGNHPEDWDKHFQLVSHINLSDYTGTDFNIIGDNIHGVFSGTFDGNGRTISGFTYATSSTECVGLFGYVSGADAEIRDLTLNNVNISNQLSGYVGALAGCLADGTISNCHINGGSVTGINSVGGLVGYKTNGTVEKSSARTTVSGTDSAEAIGGLIGKNIGGYIQQSCSSGTVSGEYQVGGLAGYHIGFMINCYSQDAVEANSAVGGLAGYVVSCVIINSYASGLVEASVDVGGLIGSASGSTFVGCFWDNTVNDGLSGVGNQTSPLGVTGASTESLQQEITYINAGWDFVGENGNGTDDIWDIQPEEYPQLWWQFP